MELLQTRHVVDGPDVHLHAVLLAVAHRKAKEAKKKQKTIETKEIRLSPNIDTNDLNTKVNQAKKFLQKGAKVKVSLRFRGREMAHKDVGREILNAFFEELKDVASVDKPAKMEGRSMVMFLSATK